MLSADMQGSNNNNGQWWKALVTGWNKGIWKVFCTVELGILSLKCDEDLFVLFEAPF